MHARCHGYITGIIRVNIKIQSATGFKVVGYLPTSTRRQVDNTASAFDPFYTPML